jgi:hypothetical protein
VPALTADDGRRIVRAARAMLIEAGSPAYAVAALAAGGGDVHLGALAFPSQEAAAQLARTTGEDEPGAGVFVVERLQRAGRYRWTVWDLAGQNRLHEELEVLPDWA